MTLDNGLASQTNSGLISIRSHDDDDDDHDDDDDDTTMEAELEV